VTAAVARKSEIRRVRALPPNLKDRGLKVEAIPEEAEVSLLGRDGVLDFFPGGGEVEADAVGILVAL